MYPAAPPKCLNVRTHTRIEIHIHTPVDDNPWSSTYIVRPPASDLTIHHHMAPVPRWEEGGVVLWGREERRGETGGRKSEVRHIV